MIDTYQCPQCHRDFTWDDGRTETRHPCPHCGAEFAPPRPTFPAGSIIGDYEVAERIGLGGMGEVYRARQLSMGGREVALKVLQGEFADDDGYLQRFYREVRTLAQIEHPNVVKAIEVGFDGRTHYFSMSFVPGRDLKHRLEAGEAFAEKEALRIVLGVAEALRHTWERHRLLHRDIKPANIIVTDDGDIKLMDLGISKYVARQDVELTVAGMMVGSPLYVSPEQAKAEKDIDFRADMYSLGATLCHLLTGHPPYEHENAMAIIAAHLSDPVPDPRVARPDLGEDASRICMRMMMKRKDDRYGSWDEAIAEMEDALGELDGEIPADGSGMPSVPPTAAPEPMAATVSKPRPTAAPPPVPAAARPRPTAAPGPTPGQMRLLRVAALLAVLLAALLGFHRIMRKSLHENDVRTLNARYRLAATELDEFRRQPTRDRFNRTYLALTQAGREAERLGETALAGQVMADLQAMNERALAVIRERRDQLCREELERLKSRSEILERDGLYAEAITLWQEYRGDFREDLADEIRRHVAFLEQRRRQRADGLE
jgi:serine/threonine-protein kinase